MENILSKKPRLTEPELSEYWGVKRKTLQKWRSLGVGPTYIKIGARVIYPRESVIWFERERLFRGSGTRIDPTEAMNKHLFES